MTYKLVTIISALLLLSACDSATITDPVNGTSSETDTINPSTGTSGSGSGSGDNDLTARIISESVQTTEPLQIGAASAAREVLVKLQVPEGIELTGTAHITLEDTIVSDTDSQQIITVSVPSEQLADEKQTAVFLPIPLDNNVEISVSVFLDMEDNGRYSTGDLISTEFSYLEINDAPEVTVRVYPI